jgi:rubrerythrin
MSKKNCPICGMTREEAIQVLQTALTSPFIYGEYAKAIDMAIEALQQPIIAKCYEIDDDHIYCSPKMAHKILDALKDRTQGEWVLEEAYGDLLVCDQCGFASEHNDRFCPNCGARMTLYKGGEEE